MLGGKLGTLFARAGHHITFSYAHSRASLIDRPNAGSNARTGSPQEAVESADVPLLAVHWTRVDDVLVRKLEISRARPPYVPKSQKQCRSALDRLSH